MKIFWLLPAMLLLVATLAAAPEVIPTSAGPLEIRLLGHATLMLRFQGRVIHVDPWSQVADYSRLPKADLVLITHHHGDHLDASAVSLLRKPGTFVYCTRTAAARLPGSTILGSGQAVLRYGIRIQAVPAYNLTGMRAPGKPYHPRGEGNGYLLTLGGKRVYIAGDTENTPEMKALRDIDIAFLPVNQPFTMTAAMVLDAVRAFRPKILYPYHFHHGTTDVATLTRLLAGNGHTELRLRHYPRKRE